MDTRHLVLLALLFAGSGCAALIYEIVWFQMLQLVIGSSAVSLSVLLGTFMGGMCLGSILLPRFVAARKSPLLVYAGLEMLIGLAAILILYIVPPIGQIYQGLVADGFGSLLLRSIACVICLLPPTVCMGATLPAVARLVETGAKGSFWIGLFYSANIIGAMFGCLLAGFYMLRIYDIMAATFAGTAVNLTVALVALVLYAVQETRRRGSVSVRMDSLVHEEQGHQSPIASTISEERQPRASTIAGEQTGQPLFGCVITDEKMHEAQRHSYGKGAPHTWTIYAATAISGFCSLAAEVIWTRTLSLLLGATVYTFSIILAVFLAGLGLGSAAASYLCRKYDSSHMLALCQILLTVAIAWASYMLTEGLPNWPIDPFLSSNPWITFQMDLFRCALSVFPAAFLWGASFPSAVGALPGEGQDTGYTVGKTYFSNTLGAIIGALATNLALIPLTGSQQCHRLLIALSMLAAIIVMIPSISASLRAPSRQGRGLPALIGGLIFSIGVCATLIATVQPVNKLLVAFGRNVARESHSADVIYACEGMNASVAVSRLPGGVRNFHVSGKIEASTEPFDMKLQLMLGHMGGLLHHKPKSALIVGCGAGTTAGSLLSYPTINRIVICEIEPLIPETAAQYFKNENNNVINDGRVSIVYDDARHYLATTREKFDIITSDPIHPWVRGAATLYTKEYFELVKNHLNEGGLVTQWVPLYESSADVVKSEVATFSSVFEGATIWANQKDGKGYDIVLLGQQRPSKIDIDALQSRLVSPKYRSVAESLARVGFTSTVDLIKTYAGRAQDLEPWLAGAQMNLDRNLRLQYLAGTELNHDRRESIYDELAGYRKFPEELLVGSGNKKEALRQTFREDLQKVRRAHFVMQ